MKVNCLSGMFLLIFCCCGMVPVSIQAQMAEALKKVAEGNPGSPDITADNFEVNRKTGWTTATGNVRVKVSGHELKADRVRLHQECGEVQAQGNVLIKREGLGAWTGDNIEYNYKTGRGLAGKGYVRAGEFYISAEELTREKDGTTTARKAVVTTCTNDVDNLHWCVTGQAVYKDNDYIEVKHAVPWFFGVPVGYMPWWYRDLDRHYGFRLIPGYTSDWGAYLLGGYVFNIYTSERDAGPKLDGVTHLDYRTARGVAVGQNLIWDLKRFGKGKFESYYTRDQDIPDDRSDRNWVSDINEERYRFKLRHKADITPRDQFLLQGTYVSDSEVSDDFFDKDNRNESTPVNFASWEHRENRWAGGAVVSGPLNDFYSGVSRLPEGWVNVMPRPLFNTGFNYESQSRAGILNRDAARYDDASPAFKYYPGEWADYNLSRVDTAHRVTRPFKVKDILSVVPRAGYRGTWYSDSELDGDVIRHSADLGVELSLRGVAELESGRRHIIEPYLDYSYQPVTYDGDDEDGRIYAFDRFDRSIAWMDQFGMDGAWLPYDWHGVRPGIRSIWQERDQHNVMRNVFLLDAYTAVQADSEGPLDQEGLRMAGTKAAWTPSEDVYVKAQTEYDTEEDAFAYVNFSTFYQLTKAVRLGGGYIGRDHEIYDYAPSPVEQWNQVNENLAYGGFTHEINDTWTYSFYTRYDLRRNDLDEVGGYIQYSLDCLVFQLRTAYINSFDRVDGFSKRDDDYRVALTMWFRAENREADDNWLTW
ncbi:MAG: LptA/OstA family protein [Kiritimatiellia bacterium]